jgi:hypothetical protein
MRCIGELTSVNPEMAKAEMIDPLEPRRSHLRHRLVGCDIQSKTILFHDFHDTAQNFLA